MLQLQKSEGMLLLPYPPPPSKKKLLFFFGGGGNLEAMRLLLRQYNSSQRPDNRVSHVWISTLSTHCVIQYTAFGFLIVRLSHKPHPSQMRLARLTVHLEERKVVRRKTWKSSFALFAAISQVSTCHLCALGALHRHPLNNGANWQRQGSYK